MSFKMIDLITKPSILTNYWPPTNSVTTISWSPLGWGRDKRRKVTRAQVSWRVVTSQWPSKKLHFQNLPGVGCCSALLTPIVFVNVVKLIQHFTTLSWVLNNYCNIDMESRAKVWNRTTSIYVPYRFVRCSIYIKRWFPSSKIVDL